MQYEFTERREYVKTIEFVNSNPLLNVEKIRYYKEVDVTGRFVKKEFRYSFDNAIWTNWATLSQANLSGIQFRDNPNFWLQIKYTREGVTTGNIQKWYLFYDSNDPTAPVTTTDASIDADYLGGQPPAYYLNRENHYGPYTSLNMENVVDGSTYGVYAERIDTSVGTTFRFKRIGALDDNVIVTEVDNKILIGVDTSLGQLDASVDELYDIVNVQGASINFLTNWNIYQDASITQLTSDLAITDASIIELRNSLIIVEASAGYLTVWNEIQDASILSLQSSITGFDASIIRIDASLDALFDTTLALEASINYNTQTNIIQDASIVRIDTILQIHEASIGDLYNWQESQDASIVNLRTDLASTDSSIERIDASLGDIYQILSNVDSSIVDIIDWQESQDASIDELRSRLDVVDSSLIDLRTYVDASLVLLETSFDASITQIWTKIGEIDASIIELYEWQESQDASITQLFVDISTLDGSIDLLFDWQYSQDASIERIDVDISVINASIGDLRADITQIEASLALITDNEVIEVGDGSIGIYAGTDASDNILLKTIDQVGPVVISDDGSTILIDSSIVKVYDTSLDDDISTYIQVGGFDVGSSVGGTKGDTYTEIIDKMLFPVLNPTLTDPCTLSFLRNGVALYETNDNPSLTFTTSFSRGEIAIEEEVKDFRSGLPYQYNYSGEGFTGDVSSSAMSRVDIQTIDISLGLNIWSSWISYTPGDQPLDSHNNNYGSPLPAGDTSALDLQAEGVYPLYATSSVITLLAKQSLVSMLEGNDVEITLVPETGGNKQRFDVPDPWENSPTNRPLIGIETYNPFGDYWVYEGGDASIAFNYWDVSTASRLVQGLSVDYITYTYNGIDRGTTKIRLKF